MHCKARPAWWPTDDGRIHDSENSREILYEFTAVGDVVRVSAVGAASGLEVTVFGPAGAGEAALRQVARRKLDGAKAKRDRAPVTNASRWLRI